MNSNSQVAYTGEVKEVFSGDDLVVLVDLGVEDLWKRQRVRLHGVDTPDGTSAGAGTEAGKVRTYVRDITRNRKVTLDVKHKSRGGWVAVVYVETPQGLVNLNDELIQQGYEFKR